MSRIRDPSRLCDSSLCNDYLAECSRPSDAFRCIPIKREPRGKRRLVSESIRRLDGNSKKSPLAVQSYRFSGIRRGITHVFVYLAACTKHAERSIETRGGNERERGGGRVESVSL